MCMKYEKEYNDCFDYMFFGLSQDITIWLKENWDININDKKKFKNKLFKLFEYCHEQKIIRPLTKDEIKIEKERQHQRFLKENK